MICVGVVRGYNGRLLSTINRISIRSHPATKTRWTIDRVLTPRSALSLL